MKTFGNRFFKLTAVGALSVAILFGNMNVQATTKPASTTKNATTTTTTTSGTTGLYFSKNSVTVGDSVKATITGSRSDTIKVRFTTSVLTLTNCTATGYTLSGNAVTFTGTKATLTFKATAAGSANVIVSATGLTGCSAKLNVQAAATQDTTPAAPAETPTPDPSTDTNQTPENSNEVTINKVKYVLQTPEKLPTELLVSSEVKIGDATYPAYNLSGTDTSFYYLYASVDNGEASWYTYDSSAGSIQKTNDDVFELVHGKSGSEDKNKPAEAKEGKKTKDSNTNFIAAIKDKINEIGKTKVMAAAGILLLAIIIIIIINLIFSKKRRNEDVFEDEEDEDTDDWFSGEHALSQAKRVDELENSQPLPNSFAGNNHSNDVAEDDSDEATENTQIDNELLNGEKVVTPDDVVTDTVAEKDSDLDINKDDDGSLDLEQALTSALTETEMMPEETASTEMVEEEEANDLAPAPETVETELQVAQPEDADSLEESYDFDDEDQTAPKKKHRFFFHKEEEVWEDDPTEDEESTSNFDDQILESAENRKAKMGSDDDFMDLNNL